jgi:structural maintenance of chromosome 1
MGKLMRIELFNFKSYKGHQRIDFGDSYFTSIIGPNGSGKSNSMDAISFVLGIKSSQLRSASLKDLIYRGRVIRENGALNPTADGDSEDPTTAWVMAVYENDAGEEQYWKRSITVNGSSEYRINSKLVTASQYNDVLEKENILIKARNFLVFQGDVEAIASQSPKDLTRLIEQISGSLEYKAEYEKLKAEQDKAAETANFNLNRRRGINAEIKQYQEQKQEVENYEKKARERDEATVTHILWKLFHFQRNIEENKAEIERHQAELKKANQQNAKYEERLENARRDHAKAARDMGKYERAIKKRENDIQDRETSLVPVNEKINITSAQVKKIAKRIQEITRDRDTQAAAVVEIKKQQKVVEKAQQQWEEEQRQLAAKSGAALSEADLQEYKKLRDQVSAKSAASQIKISNYKQQLKTDEEATSSLQTKVSDAESQVNNLTVEVGDLEARRVEVKETVDSLTSEIAEKKKEYNSMTSERLRLHQKQTELEEKLQECIHKLSEVEDSFRQNRREMKMRETVATLKRIYPGVKGRVSELCKPMMKKYGDAVSTVLGRHFDAVVVENEKTAKDCIEYLRDQRLGQYTFIPLETIHAKPINSNLKGMHRGMRMAIDTIEYDPSVERAMQYACGNAVVCDDIEVAKYICYEKGVEVKAVSLDGKVIHKGGLMSGGRVQGQQGRRFEDQEIESK